MRKVSLFTLAFVLIISLLAGCANSNNGNEASNQNNTNSEAQQPSNQETADVEQTEITFTRWGSPEEEESFTKLFAAFTEDHPNITVKTAFKPWANYWDELNISLAGDQSPDLVGMTSYMGSKYYIDLFEDIKPYIERDEVAVDQFAPGLMNALSKDGKIYALPTDLAIWAMTYNKEILDQAGIAYPSATEPMTWDQFIEIAEKTTIVNNGVIEQVGYNDQDDNAGRMNFFLSAYGGGMFDALVDPTKIIIDQPEGKKAVELIHRLSKVMPPVAEWGRQWDGGMLNKNVAMSTNGPWMFSAFKKEGIQFGVAPLPEGVAGSKVKGLINSFLISKNSKNKEEAWELLKWVSSEKGQKMVASLGLGIPIYVNLLDSPEFLGQYEGVDMSGYKYMLNNFEPVTLLKSDTFNNFLFDEFKSLMEDKITVEEFINRMTTEGQTILDDMY